MFILNIVDNVKTNKRIARRINKAIINNQQLPITEVIEGLGYTVGKVIKTADANHDGDHPNCIIIAREVLNKSGKVVAVVEKSIDEKWNYWTYAF